jgi:hypothetical protein
MLNLPRVEKYRLLFEFAVCVVAQVATAHLFGQWFARTSRPDDLTGITGLVAVFISGGVAVFVARPGDTRQKVDATGIALGWSILWWVGVYSLIVFASWLYWSLGIGRGGA